MQASIVAVFVNHFLGYIVVNYVRSLGIDTYEVLFTMSRYSERMESVAKVKPIYHLCNP